MIQFTVTVFGGLGYAFYSSWQTSLVLLAVVPFMSLSALFLVKINTTQTSRANKTYAEAGAIVYNTVSSIRTILSLNAAPIMISKFMAATQKAFEGAAGLAHLMGLANGGIMGSFMLSYIAITLYGSFLLYDNVRVTGCDPSGNVPGADDCDPGGVDVFGALLGITFAAAVLPQVSVSLEALTGARMACYPAITTMKRKVGHDGPEAANDENPPQRQASNIPFPKYEIDSSSDEGLKPESVHGEIVFNNVNFAYPTRLESNVFDGFSLKIEAGKTVAFVGTSGSGKSTSVQLIERFYDPTSGSITLDGIDLTKLSVKWLRSQIGLVGQEPALFACSIKENIIYGKPDATQEEVENAARNANCHDFISAFPNGYDTLAGDNGTSKRRIPIQPNNDVASSYFLLSNLDVDRCSAFGWPKAKNRYCSRLDQAAKDPTLG
jgi:ATP-binding cassette subfamily B (MDR/TAP) protein 1